MCSTHRRPLLFKSSTLAVRDGSMTLLRFNNNTIRNFDLKWRSNIFWNNWKRHLLDGNLMGCSSSDRKIKRLINKKKKSNRRRTCWHLIPLDTLDGWQVTKLLIVTRKSNSKRVYLSDDVITSGPVFYNCHCHSSMCCDSFSIWQLYTSHKWRS